MMGKHRRALTLPIAAAVLISGCGVNDGNIGRSSAEHRGSSVQSAGQPAQILPAAGHVAATTPGLAESVAGGAQAQNEPTHGLVGPTTQTVSQQETEEQQMIATEAPDNDPENAQAGQLPGSTNAGGPPPPPPEHVDPSAWPTHTNDTLHFRVSYPPHLSIKQLSDAERAQLSPTPAAAIDFRNDASALGPAPFAVAIFQNEAQQPLEEWLRAMGLFQPEAGWIMEPYSGKHITGLKVTTPTLMAPGWWVYVAKDALIYRLTALGAEGEAMLDSFALTR